MAEPVNMQHIDISSALSSLATTLFVRGKVNLTDAHVMSEGFYEGLLNLIMEISGTGPTGHYAQPLALDDDR